MKLKKYVVDTMPEAMQLIRKELGPNAVILQSKEVNRSRFLGLIKKKQIEVVAAIDPEPVVKQNTKKQSIQMKNDFIQQPKSTIKKNENEILNEIKNLKKVIELQVEKIGSGFAPDYELALDHLLENEVEPLIANEIINKVLERMEDNEEVHKSDIFNEMRKVIEEELNNILMKSIPIDQKVVRLIGPTGVGKTTTLAKIAAHLMLENNKKVAFITSDTYRIAAIEQLKTYARILNVPLEVVYNADDYEKAIEKFSSYDVILTDTAGRNFRDDRYIQDLINMTTDSHEPLSFLVLSLTSKPKDIIDIFERFNQTPLKGVIFTKMDETLQYGSILNIVLGKKIGIPFITNGQDVPEDLVRPNSKEIAKMIVGGD